MLLIILLIIIFVMLFSGLALFVAKAFILGLFLLPVIALVGYFLLWRNLEHSH
jgi:hypothetical protein